jgi:hypothetical protein
MKKFINSFALLLILVLSVQSLNAQTVTGKVLYQDDTTRPINNVVVVLRNIDNNSFQTYTTGGDGYYEFTNVPNGNYFLKGTKSSVGAGVTMLDAYLVFLYINGLYNFTPIQFLGADVNGNGHVNMSDFRLIVNHILRNTPFPVGPWSFESKTFAVSYLKDGVPHGLGGTCSGDVGGAFVPTVNNTAALPVAQEGTINVTNGEPFTTRILTHSDLSIKSAGIIINYPSELLQIESIEFKGNDYEYNIEDGQIRLVWGDPNSDAINFSDGESLITIHAVGTEAFKKGMSATLTLDGNTSLVNTKSEESGNLSFASPVIKYGNPVLKVSNFPNPFTTSTKLSIYAPEEGYATIEVYSPIGQLVKNISVGQMNIGSHEIDLDASQLAKGYYICKMRIQTKSGELSNSIRILKAE